MKAERWQRVERLYHAARERAAEERAAFLGEECRGDEELRREVESLLGYEGRAEHFIEAPALEIAAEMLVEGQERLAVGQTVGHYEIIAPLGAGGMGEVYLAEDAQLGRRVALKLLPAAFTRDRDRLRRFQQEARAASALNHPNILTIHEMGQVDSIHFIATEFIEGETLRQSLRRTGGMKTSEALDVAAQVASALAAAHEAGIAHRDIKPENIMIRRDGYVKVLDFGLAKLTETVAPQSVDSSAPTMPLAVHTESGVVLGTLQYMSPEQATGKRVDARSDIFSFGAVLYEMLAGQPAFRGDSPVSTLMAILHETPPPIRARRRDVPPCLDRIVVRCLEKTPGARYPSAAELLADLGGCQEMLAARRVPARVLLRRPAVQVSMLLLIALGIAVGAWLWVRQSRVTWARTVALPEARRLIGQGKTFAAFRLLRQAETHLADDPVLRDLLSESTTTVSVHTTPAGADVYVRDFFDDPQAWEFLGRAPLESVRLPVGNFVWKVSAEGFQPVERLAYTHSPNLSFELRRVEDTPENMIYIPGGRYELFSTPTADLDGYWIDKYEVTNRQFKLFLNQGGYVKREYWTEPFVDNVSKLSWEDAHRRFRDRIGRPGPATWELGTYPDGEDEYPVGGVSWHEAAAYCASVGKRLPTIYHWYYAALMEGTTNFASFSNFARTSPGPARVGHPHALGFHGTYDMAGNVKEWVWNQADHDRRYILGGGWNEPSYMFRDHAAQPSFDRSATFGFRCALYPAQPATPLMAPVKAPTRDFRLETPVSDESFSVYERLYRYDELPLDARVEYSDDSAQHWRVERVSFAAAYGGERVPALLYLPKNATPPYQTIVWFPTGNVFLQRGPFGDAEGQRRWFLFIVRSGRAVIFPMYKGTYERHLGLLTFPHVWRDIVLYSAKDLGRAVDYLETREDIDSRKLAYYGMSLGAGVGPIMTALEPRFSASILLGGGLYSWRRPPEVEAFNFLPRVKVPTLMINGRHDLFFPVDTSQEPMFRLLGVPTTEKRHRIFESGHVPSEWHEVMKEALDWLDRYLGPVPTR